MYVPNKISKSKLVWNILLSGSLLVYGTVGIYLDDMLIFGKGRDTHFHAETAWLIYVAMIFASLNMLSVVADHYDQRNNELKYIRFAKMTQIIGLFFFALALVLDFFIFKTGTRV